MDFETSLNIGIAITLTAISGVLILKFCGVI